MDHELVMPLLWVENFSLCIGKTLLMHCRRGIILSFKPIQKKLLMPESYNVGVIGYGWAATAHIPAINACENAQVTAIYSSRPLDADALSKQYGGDHCLQRR